MPPDHDIQSGIDRAVTRGVGDGGPGNHLLPDESVRPCSGNHVLCFRYRVLDGDTIRYAGTDFGETATATPEITVRTETKAHIATSVP